MAQRPAALAAHSATSEEVGTVLEDVEREHVLAASFLLIAGILFLLAFFVWVRKSPHGLCRGVFEYGLKDMAAQYELSYSPRSRVWPEADASLERDPPGVSCVYWAAWTIVLLWLCMIAVWFFLLAVIQDLAVYRVDCFVRAAAYVSAALALSALWIPLIQFGPNGCAGEEATYAVAVGCRAPNLFLASAAALTAYILSCAAEVTFDAWTYPGPSLWVFVGVGFSLLSGWLGYAAWLTIGITLSAAVRDGTSRTWYSASHGNANRYGSAKLFFATLLVVTPVSLALPSPGQPLWLVLVVGGFAPRYRWNVITVLWALGLLVINVFQVVGLRNELEEGRR